MRGLVRLVGDAVVQVLEALFVEYRGSPNWSVELQRLLELLLLLIQLRRWRLWYHTVGLLRLGVAGISFEARANAFRSDATAVI